MDLYSDFSLLNTFYLFPNIEINKTKNEKLITIKSEKRSDARLNRWTTIVNKLNDTKNPGLRIWAHQIKEYCSLFQKLMTKYMKKVGKLLKTEKKEAILAEFGNSKMRSNERLMKYPSIEFRSHFTGHRDRLVEVNVNERLLQILGYNIDSFVSNVMSEGIPIIMALNSQNSQNLMQSILKDFSFKNNLEYQSPELDCQLMTKSGYLRSSQVQVYIEAHYDNGKYEISTTFAVLEESLPSKFILEKQIELSHNKEFIELMCEKEEETAYFLKSFYKFSVHKKYTDLDKVCRIKEI